MAVGVTGYVYRVSFRCLVVPAFPLMFIGILRAFRHLHEALPLGADRRELKFRRFRAGLAPWAPERDLRAWSRRLLDEARTSLHPFRDAEDPQWLVVLQGRALPHGGDIHVRVLLGSDGSRSSVLVDRGRPGARDLPDPSPSLCPLAEPLSPGEAGDLLGLLAGFPGSFRPVTTGRFVMDGFPCQLLVTRRDPPEEVELAFNLAGIDAEVEDAPVVLARRLLGLGQRGDQSPMLVGATDGRGNITIGNV
jgi:hypothetical protein